MENKLKAWRGCSLRAPVGFLCCSLTLMLADLWWEQAADGRELGEVQRGRRGQSETEEDDSLRHPKSFFPQTLSLNSICLIRLQVSLMDWRRVQMSPPPTDGRRDSFSEKKSAEIKTVWMIVTQNVFQWCYPKVTDNSNITLCQIKKQNIWNLRFFRD